MANLSLAIEGLPLPVGFTGTPQELYEAMLERMRVIFPINQFTFVISSTEPVGNQGPWLKDGTKWYVWNEETERYVPLDISSSSQPFVVSATAPADGTVPIWLRFNGERAIGWYLWLNSAWTPVGITRGTTLQRPESPVEHERYFDTDIGVEIFWYEDEWKTVSGSPGDVKYVTWPTLEDALRYNPGWEEVGSFYEDDDARGRAITPAHKDPGATPSTSFSPGSGITARYAGEKYGEETHVLTTPEAPAHTHQSWGNAIKLIAGGFHGAAPPVLGWTVDVFETASTGGGEAHNNLPPSFALWALVKK